MTFRTRLTVTFTALVAIAGLLVVLAVYVVMRTLPTYVDPFDPPPATTQTSGDTRITIAPAGPFEVETPQQTVVLALQVSLVGLLLVVVASAFVAWLLAGRMLRPLRAVNAAAQRAGTGSFDHRVGLRGPRDELRDLSATFDEMLERLDRSFGASQRFAANASHELQTPLAATQTMLEVALSDPETEPDELRAVSRRVLETNRRSIETVSALLDLAELDEREASYEPVDLADVVSDAIAQQSAAIAGRHLDLDLTLPRHLVVRADPVLIRQAVGNLVGNAVRHNVAHGMLRVNAARDGDHVVLVLENTGAVLPPEVAESLTEPFVRGAGRTADPRAHGSGGHGLGLAIVDSIVHVHAGHLELVPRSSGGLVVTLSLPCRHSEEADPTG
jgi:two-component system, OmpR family, sensor histidine kinase VanS